MTDERVCGRLFGCGVESREDGTLDTLLEFVMESLGSISIVSMTVADALMSSLR